MESDSSAIKSRSNMGGSNINTRSTKGSSSLQMDEEAIERLITKVCNKFVKQLEEKLDSKILKLDSKLTQVCDSINQINKTVSKNSEAISVLQERLDILEQGKKRNSIRVRGLPESNSESLTTDFIKFINDKLGVVCTANDVDSVFRVGKLEENMPRSVIVNFIRSNKRNEVMAARKALKGTSVSIFEDLTPKRFQLLCDSKKKYGANKVWSSGGKIYMFDTRHNKTVKLSANL